MYTTCAFCNGKLDGDGGPSGLGVGRRLAFDEWKGRLWVICPRCSRWNLAPLEERWEKVEALARAARAGRVAAATAQVALIRWQAYDLVQVGKPPRLELATWRYGERLKARRREQMKFVLPLTVAALGVAVAVNVAAGGSFGVFIWNMPNFARSIYTGMVGRRRIELVEPPVCERCGAVLLLRAKQVARARLTTTQQADLALLLTCPNCGGEAAMLTGPDAAAALRRGLTYLNLARGGRQRAADAARLVEASGGPDRLIRGVAKSRPRPPARARNGRGRAGRAGRAGAAVEGRGGNRRHRGRLAVGRCGAGAASPPFEREYGSTGWLKTLLPRCSRGDYLPLS